MKTNRLIKSTAGAYDSKCVVCLLASDEQTHVTVRDGNCP
jgi:hypothetical protein